MPPPHATRIIGGSTRARASLARTAVSATAALLIVSLSLWPVAARAATPTCLGRAATIVGTAGDDDPLPERPVTTSSSAVEATT